MKFKFRIYESIENDKEYFEIEGETIDECQIKAKAECNKRNWNHAWSMRMKYFKTKEEKKEEKRKMVFFKRHKIVFTIDEKDFMREFRRMPNSWEEFEQFGNACDKMLNAQINLAIVTQGAKESMNVERERDRLINISRICEGLGTKEQAIALIKDVTKQDSPLLFDLERRNMIDRIKDQYNITEEEINEV